MAEPSTPLDSTESSPKIDNPYLSNKTRNYALGLLTVGYCFNFIDRQLLSILQEAIKADLGLSDGQLGLLTGFAFAMFYVSLVYRLHVGLIEAIAVISSPTQSAFGAL